jgi:membrane protease YdiL (CAAX protease family)
LRWRVSGVWYLLALYGFPVLGLLTVALLQAATLSDVLSRLPHAVLLIPANALTGFLITGPLGEEPGWRGFALPRLQVDRGPLSASAFLGLLWAFWHGPLMLIPEWRNDVPLVAFLILYSLYFIALAIIFTWVYNRAGRSALVTTVLHASFNYTIFFLDDRYGFTRYSSVTVQAVSVAVLWLVAGLLILLTEADLGMERATRQKA